MTAREIELTDALKQISKVTKEQMLMEVVVAGGAIGTCISKLPDEVRRTFMGDLEECLSKTCASLDAIGKLSVTVALNASEDPLYLQDLVAAIETHLTPP